jgi:hypothetical protein
MQDAIEPDSKLSKICADIENFFGDSVAELFLEQEDLFKQDDAVVERALYKSFLDHLPADLPCIQAYDTEYQKSLQSFQKIIPVETFLHKTQHARTLYFGDHHGIKQDKKFLASMIRTLLAQGEKINVFMECIPSKAQKDLNAYLHGHINSTTFRKKINFKQWIFRWGDYKPVFDVCKKFNVPIHGLHSGYDAGIDLADLDAHAATILQQHNNTKQIVLIGENHVAPTHLPQHVGTNNHIIASNINNTLYETLRDTLSADDILQVNDNQFCFKVMTPLDIAIAEVHGYYRGSDYKHIYVRGKPSGKEIIHTARKIHDRVHREAA